MKNLYQNKTVNKTQYIYNEMPTIEEALKGIELSENSKEMRKQQPEKIERTKKETTEKIQNTVQHPDEGKCF